MNLMIKWKNFVSNLASKGVPILVARDPKSKEPSVTLTLVVVSAGMCMISVAIMLATSIAKIHSDFTLTPETSGQIHDAFSSSFQFLIASLGGYLGRKMQSDGKGGVALEEKKPETKSEGEQ
jgi:hypothetical protein